MENATHFIEIYHPSTWIDESHSLRYPLRIEILPETLEKTRECGLKTIAIFKIKFKDATKK